MSDKRRFVDNEDGTVTDHQTGLMWTKTDTMNDFKKWVNYQDCSDYARTLRETKWAGYDDWRLPNKDEMSTLFVESCSIKDTFGKEIHISDCFAGGGGFTLVAEMVPGRTRTWIFNLRNGEYEQPDGLWTLSEATRAVRTIK